MRMAASAAVFLLLLSPVFALVEWSAVATDAVSGRPLLASGLAIFASQDGRVYAFSADTGSIAWTYDAGGRILFPAGQPDANTVAVVTDSGRLSYLGVLDGRSRGSFELGRTPVSFAAGEGRVFLGFNDSVSAVDASGRSIWNSSLRFPPGPMELSGGRLYFVSGTRLHSLVAATGAARWTAQAGESFLSRPSEGGGTVYVGSTDGKLYALEAGGGNLLWSFQTGGWVMGSPLSDGNGTYFGSNDGYFYSVDKYGHERFRVFSPGGSWARPEFYSDGGQKSVAFGTNDGKIYAVEAAGGRLLWSFSTYGRPSDLSVWAGRTLIFGTDKGRIYSLSPAAICSFDWPPQMEVVGGWPVDVEGKARASDGISSVEVRISGGSWTPAEGAESWHATVDLSRAEAGAVSIECRVRDRNGRTDTQEFSSLLLVKSENAPLQKMYVEAPSSAGAEESFTVTAKDSRGVEIRNVKITVGSASQAGDSPFAVVLGKSGDTTITLDKPGFEPRALSVRGTGGTDWGLIFAGIALVAAAAYFLFGRKLLARKRP